MAKSISTMVKAVQLNQKKSKYTEQEYQELNVLCTDGKWYKGIVEKGLTVPEIGDTIDLVYQEINGSNKQYNSIVSLQVYNSNRNVTEILNPDKNKLPWENSKTLEMKLTPEDINEITNRESKQMTKATTTTTSTKTERQTFKIKGTLWYAHVKERDTKGEFPTNKYKVELSVSDTTKQALEELGVLVKNKDNEKGDYVIMKTDYQPQVVGVDGTQLTEVPMIGNGSIATVTVSTYKNKAAQGGKVCLGFSKVELETFVPYETEAKMLTNE